MDRGVTIWGGLCGLWKIGGRGEVRETGLAGVWGLWGRFEGGGGLAGWVIEPKIYRVLPCLGVSDRIGSRCA